MISQPGIIITIFLVLIPLLAALLFMVVKANSLYYYLKGKKQGQEASRYAAYLKTLDREQILLLQKKQQARDYKLQPRDLATAFPAQDERGLLSHIQENAHIRFVEAKRKAPKRPHIAPSLSRLILWFLGTATCWLLFGTTGREGVRKVPFVVRNGPDITVEGLREHEVVDGVLPIMISAYGKGDQKIFLIDSSEPPRSIPNWVWVTHILFGSWAIYYLITQFTLH